MRTPLACAPIRVRTVWLLIFGLVLTIGCAAETPTQPTVVLPATGSPMTPEWNEYNRQAEIKDAPILRLVVTAKSRTATNPREAREIQDVFDTQDERLYVLAKWTNVKGKPTYKIRIYDPRGVLFREWKSIYRHSTGKWGLWNVLYIKGWAAGRLPGQWRAEIFMNGQLAKTKEFVIGSETHRYERRATKGNSQTIGVFPYFINSESSQTNHRWLPLYIAQMLTIDFENHQVAMPFQLRKDVTKPIVKYEQVREFFSQELNSPESELNALVKKHNLDLIIAGRVFDSATYGEEKEVTFYLINTKTKQIQEIKTSFTSIKSFEGTALRVRANFYKDVYDQLLKEGVNEFKIAVPTPTRKPVVSSPKAVTLEDRLQKLMELRRKNLITNEEYERAKKDVLRKLTE